MKSCRNYRGNSISANVTMRLETARCAARIAGPDAQQKALGGLSGPRALSFVTAAPRSKSLRRPVANYCR
jgi:hypothetical protein